MSNFEQTFKNLDDALWPTPFSFSLRCRRSSNPKQAGHCFDPLQLLGELQ